MTKNTRRTVKRIAVAVGVLGGIVGVVVALATVVPRQLVSLHQSGVTLELADWQQVVKPIHSVEEARVAVDWIEYIQNYYPVGEGYRGTARSESALESQRKSTIGSFVSVLKEFIGEDFGADVAQWRICLESVDTHSQGFK